MENAQHGKWQKIYTLKNYRKFVCKKEWKNACFTEFKVGKEFTVGKEFAVQ